MKITPLFHRFPAKTLKISEATRRLLGMGFQRLQWSIGVWQTNIDFSQDQNKLIHPPEVGYLCKHNSAAINAEPWLDSLHRCNAEHQLLDRGGGGGRVTCTVIASFAANYRNCKLQHISNESIVRGNRLKPADGVYTSAPHRKGCGPANGAVGH